MTSPVLLASLVLPLASGHGQLTLPPSRNGGTLAVAGQTKNKEGGNVVCSYYTLNVETPDELVTNCNARTCDMRKSTICSGLFAKNCPSDCDGKYVHPNRGPPGSTQGRGPWLAPGTASVKSPCGIATNAAVYVPPSEEGKDGRDLPVVSRVRWTRGSTASVAAALMFNHGGGWAYRLCPADAEQTEECFAKHHLEFHGSTSILHFTNGTEVEIPAVTLSHGTYPKGSQWRVDPIPNQAPVNHMCPPLFEPPYPGCPGHVWPFSVKDEVKVPASLPAGKYTLSWRWDCELNTQVWANCADVELVDATPLEELTNISPALAV